MKIRIARQNAQEFKRLGFAWNFRGPHLWPDRGLSAVVIMDILEIGAVRG